jgi:hypothetical protein
MSSHGDNALGPLLSTRAASLFGQFTPSRFIHTWTFSTSVSSDLGGCCAFYQRRRLRNVDARPAATLDLNEETSFRTQSSPPHRRHLRQHWLSRHYFRQSSGLAHFLFPSNNVIVYREFIFGAKIFFFKLRFLI